MFSADNRSTFSLSPKLNTIKNIEHIKDDQTYYSLRKKQNKLFYKNSKGLNNDNLSLEN